MVAKSTSSSSNAKQGNSSNEITKDKSSGTPVIKLVKKGRPRKYADPNDASTANLPTKVGKSGKAVTADSKVTKKPPKLPKGGKPPKHKSVGNASSGTSANVNPTDSPGAITSSGPTPTAASGKTGSKPKPDKKRKTRPAKEKKPASANLERQCGVTLQDGGTCLRALTCKSHSVASKRAVPGRSKPYDTLLVLYQQRNQFKQSQAQHKQAQNEMDQEEDKETTLTDEQEFEQVKAGVARSSSFPLDRHTLMPVRLKRGFLRMRETLMGCVSGVGPINLASAESTSAMLGRTIVFDSVTHQTFTRPPTFLLTSPSSSSSSSGRQRAPTPAGQAQAQALMKGQPTVAVKSQTNLPPQSKNQTQMQTQPLK